MMLRWMVLLICLDSMPVTAASETLLRSIVLLKPDMAMPAVIGEEMAFSLMRLKADKLLPKTPLAPPVKALLVALEYVTSLKAILLPVALMVLFAARLLLVLVNWIPGAKLSIGQSRITVLL